MKFYSEPSFYKAGSGLMRQIDGAKTFDVVTVSVDDFCQVNCLHPSFMKVDVEGAEIHVLLSATKLIDTRRLPIIIEYQATVRPDENDPLVYLEKKVLFFDVNTYQQVSAEIYSAMSDLPLVNVLCIHRDTALANSYINLTKNIIVKNQLSQNEVLLVEGIDLDRGRYVVEVNFYCPDDVIGGLAVKNASGYLAYYEADAKHLRQHSCSSIVIELSEPQLVSVEFIKKADYPAGIKKITITKIEIGKEVR